MIIDWIIIEWTVESILDRYINWMNEWFTDQLNEWLTRIIWLIDRIIKWMIDRPFTEWMIDKSTEQMIDRSTEWIIDRITEWMIDRSTEWMIDRWQNHWQMAVLLQTSPECRFNGMWRKMGSCNRHCSLEVTQGQEATTFNRRLLINNNKSKLQKINSLYQIKDF